jgi:hypothetical protein
MHPHILDRQTVNAMFPLIQHIADELDLAYLLAAEFLATSCGDRADPDLAGYLDRVQACVVEVEQLGGTVRACAPVRIDFTAEVDGEIGYLCWERGDSEATNFHTAMDACDRVVLSA